MSFIPPPRPYAYSTPEVAEQIRQHTDAVLFLADAVIAVGRLLDERLPTLPPEPLEES